MDSQDTEEPVLSEETKELLANEPVGSCAQGATWISPYRILLPGEQQSPNAISLVDSRPHKPDFVFEFAEHGFLGDQINLKYMKPKSDTDSTPDGKEVELRAFKLPLLKLGQGNVLKLTYGQISALAGDFYGTSNPISSVTSNAERTKFFFDAYHTLAKNPQDQPKDARNLLGYLQKEIDEVQKLYDANKNPSEYYKDGTGLAGIDAIDKLIKGRHFPGYKDLLLVNWDHFGDDARTAYTTGHSAAISWAASGTWTVDRLVEAYAINSFADHYLQDLFSAGHLRTPRRVLHGYMGAADALANMMHDEDCALGLKVANKNSSWQAYGDKRLLDSVNKENLLQCQTAMLISAQEVYSAWKSRKEIASSDFEVWKTVPTKESAMGGQIVAPLFKLGKSGKWGDLERRSSLKNRREWKFTTGWTTAGTLADKYATGAWNYPMHV
ncbi:phosphatidylcholine-hydrolyzing phospholipase C [Metarhizium brunneum]